MMASKRGSRFALLVVLANAAEAHVLLKTPVPYGAATLNTNPLLSDGSDYPCKQRQGWDAVTHVNVMPIGQPQVMSFQGQATHGGGVCQLSLTTDTPPTKDSVFKVIHSIVGGCPSTNPGNVGTDPFGYGADKFTFSIPQAVPAGKNYTLAWTWFNKIGDREMYMNCAPITVPSSAQRRSFDDIDGHTFEERDANSMAALPDMFRANIGAVGGGCTSPASGSTIDVPKDNLGTNIQRIGTEPVVPPIGNCGGTYGASPGAAAPAAPAASVSTQPVSAPKPSASAALPAKPTSPPPVPVTSSSAAPPTASPSAAAPAPVPGLTTGTCPTPGKSVCSPDGTGWGTCDENHHVIYQKVSADTKCDPALGVEVHLKRHIKRSHKFRA